MLPEDDIWIISPFRTVRWGGEEERHDPKKREEKEKRKSKSLEVELDLSGGISHVKYA